MRSKMVFNYGTELSDALAQGGTLPFIHIFCSLKS